MSSRQVQGTCIAFVLVALGLRPGVVLADWPGDPFTNLAICTAFNTQSLPAIAGDGVGGAIITWQDARTIGVSGLDIYAQHVVASGIVDGQNWPADGRLVCGLTGSQSSPRIVADGVGGGIIAWQDARTGGAAHIYAQHVLASGSLDPAWPVDGLAVCTAAGSQTTPAMVSDGAGGAYVGWIDFRTDTTLYLQRVRSNGVVDAAWPVNGLSLGGRTLIQAFALLADGKGGAIVAWADHSGGPTADIVAQRVLGTGALAAGWPAGGRIVCAAANQQQFPSLATDRAGGAIVAWEDLRNGSNSDIYSQHVSANGTVDPAWPAGGRAICTATGSQVSARAVSDGGGGAIVGWQDSRLAGATDLYAQRVRASGNVDPGWPADGRALCLASGPQGNLTLVSDGSGGALATWDDIRVGTADVYAHHILGTGLIDPAWTTDGVPVCLATASQSSSAPVGDGSGGLVIAWMDGRAGTNPDIYAQRIQPNGQLGGTSVGVPSEPATAFALSPLAPTPARGGALGLHFSLPEPGRVSAELLDPSGRRLASRDLGERTAGPQSLSWTLERRVTPGLYFLRVRFGLQSRTIRTVILD